jgi:type II secretion system protein I
MVGETRGFTLLEVLIALAIIGIVVILLLGRRAEILDEAAIIRDYKIAWHLAAQKMSQIELDKELFKREGTYQQSGEFEGYEGFSFTYEVTKEEVEIGTPGEPGYKPREIYRVTLTVGYPSAVREEDHIKLHAYFPKISDASIPR